MEEIWRPLVELPDIAEVSNMGGVRTRDRGYTFASPKYRGLVTRRVKGREISQAVTRHGYAQIQIIHAGKVHKWRVHRLVAQAFVLGGFEGAHVDHLDGNKLNNRADNLEWVTKQENTRRQWATGLNRGHPTKVTDMKAHAIKVLYDHNFPPSVIAEWFGISTSHAYQIGAGKTRAAKLKSRRQPHL